MGGLIGFDYAALPFILAAHDVPRSEWRNYLDKIDAVSKLVVRHSNSDKAKDSSG